MVVDVGDISGIPRLRRPNRHAEVTRLPARHRAIRILTPARSLHFARSPLSSTSKEAFMEDKKPRSRPRRRTALAAVLDRNIRTLLAQRERRAKVRTVQERLADAITNFSGRME